ncbi:hypothetical protein AB1Y20_015429 [Prymnesium parvum]|uniref:Uncharacterized protein n=1 Tax=Prymnesium parvum TaxID=97485 RepID=A0AB34K0Q1_PRYPA
MLLLLGALHTIAFQAAAVTRATPRGTLPFHLRGGATEGSVVSYATEAAALFANMGGAAAFLAGGMVPLSTFAGPKPAPSDSPAVAKIKRVHAIVASSSLLSLLTSVMYATISNNKLRETVVGPTASVKALLVGEYALQWVGCNAHFIMGLYGFATAVGINVWLNFGASMGKASACGASAALLLMLSIVNDAVSQRSQPDLSIGGSVFSLLIRYFVLLVQSMVAGRRALVFLSMCLGISAVYLAARAVTE